MVGQTNNYPYYIDLLAEYHKLSFNTQLTQMTMFYDAFWKYQCMAYLSNAVRYNGKLAVGQRKE